VNTNPLLIGKRNPQDGRGFPVNGKLDEVAIWTRPLTDSEIASLYNSVGSSAAPGSNVLPATTALSIAAGSTLDLNGSTQQVASLSDYASGTSGSIINSSTAASVLTLSATGGTTKFSGLIEGGGTLGTISLAMSGSGTQVLAGSLLGPGSLAVNSGTMILSGSNTYSGGTTINAGTLILASNAALPDGTSLAVGEGGALIFDSTAAGAPVVGSQAASSMSASVPEPRPLVLLAAGAAVATFAAQRRRRRT
jgi:autotransporter-associated beta strand protein